MSEIHYSCKECGWSFTLSNNVECPMCGERPKLDRDFLIKVLVEYTARKAYEIKPKEAKKILKRYKKEYKNYPSPKELWELADRLIEKHVEAKFGKKEKKKGKVEEVLKAGKEKKKKRKEKEEIKEERKKKLQEERKEEEGETVACIYCGFRNPIDSSFCGKCGKKV